MITPTYEPDVSLTDLLAANGFGHRPSTIHNKRVVFALDSQEEVGAMDHTQCTDWLKGRVRAFELRGVE